MPVFHTKTIESILDPVAQQVNKQRSDNSINLNIFAELLSLDKSELDLRHFLELGRLEYLLQGDTCGCKVRLTKF